MYSDCAFILIYTGYKLAVLASEEEGGKLKN